MTTGIYPNIPDNRDDCNMIVKDGSPTFASPFDDTYDEEYQKFIEEMAKECHCSIHCRSCEGVLAAGLCDGITEERNSSGNDDCFDEDDDFG